MRKTSPLITLTDSVSPIFSPEYAIPETLRHSKLQAKIPVFLRRDIISPSQVIYIVKWERRRKGVLRHHITITLLDLVVSPNSFQPLRVALPLDVMSIDC